MSRKTLSEKKAILLAQERGLEVPQVETKHYKEKGFIQTGNPLNAFIKTLEQVYEKVTLRKNPKTKKPFVGVKREYILVNELDTVIEREDKRVMKLSSTEESFKNAVLVILIDKHLKNDKCSYTTKHWAFKVFNANLEINKAQLSSNIYNSLDFSNDESYQNLFDVNFIASDLYGRYLDATRNLVEKTFKVLEREGSIKLTNTFAGATVDADGKETYKTIREELHNEISLIRNQMVKKEFGSHAKYAKVYSSEDEVDVKTTKEFQSRVQAQTGYFYSFKNLVVEVTIDNPQAVEDVDIHKLNTHTLSVLNFKEKMANNRTVENIVSKWNGEGKHPLGYITNVFAQELVELVLTSNKVNTVKFDETMLDVYVASYNANLNTEYKLTKKNNNTTLDMQLIKF